MISFKKYLETIDSDNELLGINNLNMTANLPFKKENPLKFISGLTRGFHLNTIVGRMLRPWINSIKLFEDKKDAVIRRLPDSTNEIFGINKKYIDKDGSLNNNFLSAYDLFKDEISRSINNLPYKIGKDIHSGEFVDPLNPVKDFLKKYNDEGDFLESLDKALDISLMVLGHRPEQVRNFINFLEIVRDEFITIGEKLPTLSEPILEKNKKYQKNITIQIKKYEKLYRSNI